MSEFLLCARAGFAQDAVQPRNALLIHATFMK
jgi:hypothetical protein